MVRLRARLDADQAGREAIEKIQQLRALQFPANDNRALGINAMDLKHPLRNIQAD